MRIETTLPKIGSPAERALASAGIETIKQLEKYSEAEIANLHGVGPKAIIILKAEMKRQGINFKK